jgi:hypothetical protein
MTDKAVPNTLEQKLDAGHKVADGAKAETVATDPKNSAKARRMEMLAVLGAHSPTLDQLKKDQQLNPSAIARPFTLVSESGHEISSTPKPDGARAQERGEITANKNEVRDSVNHTDAAAEAKAHAAIEKKYGVHVVIKDGRAEYHLQAGNKDTTLFTLPEGDIKDAEKYLAAEVQKREGALNARYGATFSSSTDTIPTVSANGDSGTETGRYATCRPPRLDELVGVEAALAHCQPSDRSLGNAGTKFYFLRDGQHYAENRAGGANYIKGDPPKVFIDPSEHINAPTEADRQSMHSPRSMEYDITHELTHNAQYRLGWDNAIDKNKKADGHAQAETLESSTAKEMGWVRTTDGHYYLMGKDGTFFQCNPSNPNQWFAFKPDKHGTLQKVENSQVNSQFVREHALVTPPTNYFSNPKEEMAECLTLYRLGSGYQEILARNPVLFSLTQKIDQDDINKTYPPRGHTPSVVRRSDGTLERAKESQ